MLLAQLVRPAPAGDFADLVSLASAARDVFAFWQLVADGGYDSEANYRSCRDELRVESLIPAHNRRGARAKTEHQSRMQRLLGVPGTAKRGTERACHDYGQRWEAETLMSVVEAQVGRVAHGSSACDATATSSLTRRRLQLAPPHHTRRLLVPVALDARPLTTRMTKSFSTEQDGYT